MADFAALDAAVDACYTDPAAVRSLVPNTLEGCVVRVSDIIAYVGKDRQDAEHVGVGRFSGDYNSRFINNIVVNLVENSFGKEYLSLDEEYFNMLSGGKRDNYESIYGLPELGERYENEIKPLFEELYDCLLSDLAREDGVVRRHHIDFVNRRRGYYGATIPYEEETSPDDIVVDYIASMTDDYFIDLCDRLFGGKVEYVGYFRDLT